MKFVRCWASDCSYQPTAGGVHATEKLRKARVICDKMAHETRFQLLYGIEGETTTQIAWDSKFFQFFFFCLCSTSMHRLWASDCLSLSTKKSKQTFSCVWKSSNISRCLCEFRSRLFTSLRPDTSTRWKQKFSFVSFISSVAVERSEKEEFFSRRDLNKAYKGDERIHDAPFKSHSLSFHQLNLKVNRENWFKTLQFAFALSFLHAQFAGVESFSLSLSLSESTLFLSFPLQLWAVGPEKRFFPNLINKR